MRRGEEWGADRTGEEMKKKWRRKKKITGRERRKKEECRAERLRDPGADDRK